jgi:hypothetical protein
MDLQGPWTNVITGQVSTGTLQASALPCNRALLDISSRVSSWVWGFRRPKLPPSSRQAQAHTSPVPYPTRPSVRPSRE